MTFRPRFSAFLLPIAVVSFAGCAYNPPVTYAGSTAASSNLAPGSASILYTTSTQPTVASGNGTTYATSVIGYPADAAGAVSPTLTISSPNPMEAYVGLATDSAGNIYVLSADFDSQFNEVPGSAKILVFAPATSGTMTANPIRTIAGPAANLQGVGRLAVDSAGNIYLWESGSDVPPVAPATIVEFAAGASGNVAPIRSIQVAQFPSTDGSGYPEGLAVDAVGNIVFAVANAEGHNGTVNTESDEIEIFTPGQSGNATPARTISGPQSQLTQIAGLALDANSNIYVEMATVGTGDNSSIVEFAGGASTTAAVAPINTIAGSATLLGRFFLDSLTVDNAGNIYVLDYTFPGVETNYLLRFAPGTTGNAMPAAATLSQEGVLLAAH